MFKIKKINETICISQPPNGGWGWIVMAASFFILGNAFGISKSFGIYFLDIKFEFEVTNSATSWISSLFLGAIGMAGGLKKICLRSKSCLRSNVYKFYKS